MTTITTLPTPPSRGDPATFSARGDALLGALPAFVTETNAVAGEVNAAAAAASASASTASTQAGNASASASTASTQAGNASASAAAAAASYDSFDDRYLGSKTADPALDNDGAALLTGALYWNISAVQLRVYDGATWQALPTGAPVNALLKSGGTMTGAIDMGGQPISNAGAGAFDSLTIGGIPVGVAVNTIGVPSHIGFGVGICPDPLPSGMVAMPGYDVVGHDNYGNYQYSDGSVMVWVPAYYYKWGTGANGLALNAVDIKPFSAYADVATANAAGYALHRAFYDGGIQPGVFVDKYIPSNNGGIASSLKNGVVLTSAVRGGLANTAYASLTGAPANNQGGSIAVCKTRGANFFPSSRFIFAALALLSYAHARASTSTTYCAWYHATNNFPKGNNNNALGDAQDAAILYTHDGNATYAGCGKTGSANLFARTTHNGQNCGCADLNGLVWETTPGLTSNGTNLYILKTTVRMKDVTGGNTLATDLWGATGIAAMYNDLGTTYEALWATGVNRTTYFGSASQVFSVATSGNAWNYAGLGGPLAAGVGGTNAFGNDIIYDFKPNEMAPFSGGSWSNSSGAGAFALALNDARANSYGTVGCRSALYL